MFKKSGTFEDIDIVFCKNCNKRNILPAKFVDTVDEFLTPRDFECKECGYVDQNPVWNVGVKFKCPDCEEENIQSIEPNNIENYEGFNVNFYNRTDLCCYHCESSFRMVLLNQGDFLPPENLLFKETINDEG